MAVVSEGKVLASLPLPIAEDIFAYLLCLQSLEDGLDGLIDGQVPPLVVLGIEEGKNPLFEIDLIPFQAQEFPLPHPRIQGHGNNRLQVIRAV